MEIKPSNSNVLEQLRNGFARFELVSSPAPSVPDSLFSASLPASFFGSTQTQGNSHVSSPEPVFPPKQVEHYDMERVSGDSRCLFRALVKGMAFRTLDPYQETIEADKLQTRVRDAMCNDEKEREKTYKKALEAIKKDYESVKSYCQRIGKPDFSGGNSELLVLSKLCEQPIIVYKHGEGGSGFIQIDEYGAEFLGGFSWKFFCKKKKKNVVRLVRSANHFDLLR